MSKKQISLFSEKSQVQLQRKDSESEPKNPNQILSFDGVNIREDKVNNMISLTDIWKAAGSIKNQEPYEWLRLPGTKLIVESLLKEGTYFQKYEKRYLTVSRGRAGTWGHRKIAEEYRRYLKFSKARQKDESEIRDNLVKQLKKKYGGYYVKTDVKTDAGYIDILTPEHIIEVKKIKYWKNAVGQVLVYGIWFSDRKPVIHLFGKMNRPVIKVIKDTCTKLDVAVSLEEN